MAKIPFDYEEITVGATAVGLTTAEVEAIIGEQPVNPERGGKIGGSGI